MNRVLSKFKDNLASLAKSCKKRSQISYEILHAPLAEGIEKLRAFELSYYWTQATWRPLLDQSI